MRGGSCTRDGEPWAIAASPARTAIVSGLVLNCQGKLPSTGSLSKACEGSGLLSSELMLLTATPFVSVAA
jgi:hypothetical protein